MKKVISVILVMTIFCFFLTGCGYSESEKFSIAREEIEANVHSSIMAGTMLKYGVRDLDLKISSFEEDQYSKITVESGEIEPKAFRIKGTYYLDGVYINKFEGVYAVTFYKDSRKIGPIHEQSLTY